MDQIDFGGVLNAATLWAAIQASEVWQLLVSIGIAVAFLWQIGSWVIARAQAKQVARVVATLSSTTHVQSFTDEEIQAAVKHYIVPDCSNVDPSNESDIRHFVGVREQVFTAIDRALATEGKQHLLVLADSGMGKTTFLLNLFAQEQKRAKKSRRPMAIVPLGRPDAVDQVKAIQNKRSTLLLLDALDEDTAAIKDHRSRLDELMRVSGDFKALILTCRTQFFSNDEDIPSETGILRVTPRRAGISASQEFRKVYLLPFTEIQVQRYVRLVIPLWKPLKRKHATSIVHKIPELSVRPMLLAMLPELISERSEMNELWQLYEFMVDKWLQRESIWIDPVHLMKLSTEMAVDLVLNRDLRGGERISPSELADHLKLASEEVEKWKLTTRSLLNRDSAGNFKFAHRSIMEFLFIKALIEGQDRCASVAWTDMMCSLFLSWGRVSIGVADTQKVDHLLLHTDLTRTKLFPVMGPDEPASSIDAHWAKAALIKTGLARNRAGIPAEWISRTSRCRINSDMVSVYEFAEGIVWRFTDTKKIMEYGEQEIFKDDIVHIRRTDNDKGWRDPRLSEFNLLVRTLIALKTYELDDRDLYWLADEDQTYVAAARVRWLPNAGRGNIVEQSSIRNFPGGAEFIYSSLNNKNPMDDYIIDVYRVPKVRITIGSSVKSPPVRALRIRTFRGEAQRLWDLDDPTPKAMESNRLI